MRALALVLLVAIGALLAAPAPAAAHGPARCEPPFTYPSLALWVVPAGGTSSFYMPPNYFGSFVASLPLDVTMFRFSTCAMDASCHHHGMVGPFLCGSTPASIIEFHNPGTQGAPLALAIGLCADHTVCDNL